MNPIAIELGFIKIYWYSLLLVVAFVIGYFLLIRLGTRKEIKKNILENYFIWLLISLIIGARLFEVLFYSPSYYFSNPIKILYIWEGGIASHGAIFGGIIATYFFTKKHNLRFYQLTDLVVIPVALGAVFIRIGNFINGELVGKITNNFIGVKFDKYNKLRHPVQLYQAATNFILFGILYSMKSVKEGVLSWTFIGLFSLFRFFTEFYKDLPNNYGFIFLGLNLAQWFSILGIILSITLLLRICSQSSS